jgi:hypothetical protein
MMMNYKKKSGKNRLVHREQEVKGENVCKSTKRFQALNPKMEFLCNSIKPVKVSSESFSGDGGVRGHNVVKYQSLALYGEGVM